MKETVSRTVDQSQRTCPFHSAGTADSSHGQYLIHAPQGEAGLRLADMQRLQKSVHLWISDDASVKL